MTPRALALAALSCAFVAGTETTAQSVTDKDKIAGPAVDAKTQPRKASAPGVRILFVETKKTTRGETVEICIGAEDRGGGVAKVELTVDGAPLKALTRAVVQETGEECPENSLAFETDLIPGPNNFEAVAYTSDGTASQPARETVQGTSPLATTTLHILTIGIDTYREDAPALSFARNDARAFADSLRKQAAPLFARVRVDSLFDAAATKDAIESRFLQLADSVGENDTFVFFYAGHGALARRGQSQNESFFLTSVDVTDLRDWKMLASEGIHAGELLIWLSGIASSSKLLVFDACNSGSMGTFLVGKEPIGRGLLGTLGTNAEAGILAATQPSGAANEPALLGRGLFTAALLQHQREPGNRPEVRKIDYLASAARGALRPLSKQYGVVEQEPWMRPPPQDFPLIVR
ncbi:MAG: caspase family protein [Gemmatimonadaceae bacterium]